MIFRCLEPANIVRHAINALQNITWKSSNIANKKDLGLFTVYLRFNTFETWYIYTQLYKIRYFVAKAFFVAQPSSMFKQIYKYFPDLQNGHVNGGRMDA